MDVAMGVNMNSKHILPYLEGMKTVYYVNHRNKLTPKAKLKLKCYELHKNEGLSILQLSKIFKKDKSTIYRWINQTKKALRISKVSILRT